MIPPLTIPVVANMSLFLKDLKKAQAIAFSIRNTLRSVGLKTAGVSSGVSASVAGMTTAASATATKTATAQTAAHTAAKNTLARANKTVAASQNVATASVTNWSTALSIASGSMHMYTSRLMKLEHHVFMLGQTLRRAGWAALGSITAPLMIIGGLATSSFLKFENAMTKSMAIMQSTSQQLIDTAANHAKRVSETIAYSAKELAEGYYYLASTGLNLTQSIKALKPAAEFATAGVINLAKSVELLTSAQSAIGWRFQDPKKNMLAMTVISDSLVRATQRAQGTTEEFAEAMSNFAAASSRMYGIELEDLIAVLETFAAQGLRGKTAGMRLNMTFRGVTNAVTKHAEAFRKYGIAIFDTQGNIRKTYKWMADLERVLLPRSIEKRVKIAQELGFTYKSLNQIMMLLGNSERLFIEYQDQLNNKFMKTKEVAEKQMRSWTNQLIMVKNTIVNSFMDLGEALAPSIISVGKKVAAMLKGISNLSEEVRLKLMKIGLIFLAYGPALLFVGGIIQSFSMLIKVVVGVLYPLKLVSGLITIIVSGIGSIIALVSSTSILVPIFGFLAPFIGIASAVALTAFGIKKLSNSVKNGEINFKSMGATAAGVFYNLGENAKRLVVYLDELFTWKNIGKGLGNWALGISDWIMEIVHAPIDFLFGTNFTESIEKYYRSVMYKLPELNLKTDLPDFKLPEFENMEDSIENFRGQYESFLEEMRKLYKTTQDELSETATIASNQMAKMAKMGTVEFYHALLAPQGQISEIQENTNGLLDNTNAILENTSSLKDIFDNASFNFKNGAEREPWIEKAQDWISKNWESQNTWTSTAQDWISKNWESRKIEKSSEETADNTKQLVEQFKKTTETQPQVVTL